MIGYHQMRMQELAIPLPTAEQCRFVLQQPESHDRVMPISLPCQKITLFSLLFSLAICTNSSTAAASYYQDADGLWIEEDGPMPVAENPYPDPTYYGRGAAPYYSPSDCQADAIRLNPDAVLAAHNRWRRAAWVPPLEWSEELAQTAQEWADYLSDRGGCLIQHSNSGYGENIYQAAAVVWSDGRAEVQQKHISEIVDRWASEIQYYDYASNTCSSDICGHYTQLVWRDTRRVGCGVSVCPSKKRIWVCHYDPPGNVAGQRPY
jgi:pathogenesis-related protein 1